MNNITPQAIIWVIGIIGALAIFTVCFKKQPGTFGKKGLFSTAMLCLYLVLMRGLVPVDIKSLLVPLLGFSILAVVEIFKQKDN